MRIRGILERNATIGRRVGARRALAVSSGDAKALHGCRQCSVICRQKFPRRLPTTGAASRASSRGVQPLVQECGGHCFVTLAGPRPGDRRVHPGGQHQSAWRPSWRTLQTPLSDDRQPENADRMAAGHAWPAGAIDPRTITVRHRDVLRTAILYPPPASFRA